MPIDRKPDAAPALTNAERQAKYRARRQALHAIPAIRYRRPADRRSRPTALARRRRRVARLAGRIHRLVRYAARRPRRDRHRGGAPGHRRTRPQRARRNRTAPGYPAEGLWLYEVGSGRGGHRSVQAGNRQWAKPIKVPRAQHVEYRRRVHSRTDLRRATEVDVAVHALNRMLELGRPISVRIA